jgi:enoyl-CoA hydratase/carnithine racemase
MAYETVLYEVDEDHVATVTLNRPEVLNAFNQLMADELSEVWQSIRRDDHVHAVVLCAAGDKGFCSGLDLRGGEARGSMDDWDFQDVAVSIGPKHNQVWKPVVTAVHGSCCAGAMYFLNESDIVIASEEAMFFDSHVSYGIASVFEAIGMRMFVPAREALRWLLLDLEERMSAQRALQIGLISEVVSREDLLPHAHELAAIIAAKPPYGVQGSIKAFWDGMWPQFTDVDRWGIRYTAMAANHRPPTEGPPTFMRPQWKLR